MSAIRVSGIELRIIGHGRNWIQRSCETNQTYKLQLIVRGGVKWILTKR